MRVLLVSGLTMRGRGGAQRATVRLLRGLREHGAKAALAADRPSDEYPTGDFVPIAYPPGPGTESQIARVVRDHRPDLVHVVGGGFRILNAVRRTCARVPWVVSIHNIPPAERSSPWLIGRNRLYYALRRLRSLPTVHAWRRFLSGAPFTAAVCYSEHVRRAALHAGAPSARVHTIPFGMDPAEPAALEGAARSLFPAGCHPRLVTVGGLIHHKGFHDAVEAIGRLLGRWPRLHYMILGEDRDARYSRFLRGRIARLGLQAHVSVRQDADEPARVRALREADLYLQPSHEEGFCLAHLEAATITPRLLGTGTGAIPEMSAADPTMRVVPTRDPGSIEREAAGLLAMTPGSSDLAERHRRLAGAFSWETHIGRHIALYRAAISGLRPTPSSVIEAAPIRADAGSSLVPAAAV